MFYGATAVPTSIMDNDINYISNEAALQTNLSLMDDAAINPPLTPSTLNSIEQTFMQMQQPITTTSYITDGFQQNLPIKAEPMFDESSSYTSDQGYYADVKESHGENFIVPNIDPVTYLVENSRRPTGPRRKRKIEDLSQDEMQKLGMRRERNRKAAAKCRERRDNHTLRLVHETEQLEQEQSNLEGEIYNLQQQKQQLELLLQGHLSTCALNTTAVPTHQVPTHPVPSHPVPTHPVTTHPTQSNAACSIASFSAQNNSVFSGITENFSGITENQNNKMFPDLTGNQTNCFNFSNVNNMNDDVFNFGSQKTSFPTMATNVPTTTLPNTTCSAQLRRYSFERSLSNGLVSPRLLC